MFDAYFFIALVIAGSVAVIGHVITGRFGLDQRWAGSAVATWLAVAAGLFCLLHLPAVPPADESGWLPYLALAAAVAALAESACFAGRTRGAIHAALFGGIAAYLMLRALGTFRAHPLIWIVGYGAVTAATAWSWQRCADAWSGTAARVLFSGIAVGSFASLMLLGSFSYGAPGAVIAAAIT
nr:hypothetical protein [Planctomycetota bacterium]